MFDLLFLLPRVFTLGQDIMRCLDGDVTDAEYQRVLDSLTALVTAIPALQGFIALIQSLLKVARVAFPIIEAVQQEYFANNMPMSSSAAASVSANRMSKFKALVKQELTETDIKHAKASARILTDVSSKVAQKVNVSPAQPERKPIDMNEVFGFN